MQATRARRYERAHLEGLADEYLDALSAHDPGRLPLSDDVRFTENGQELEPGDGLWATFSGLGTYRHHITDTLAGQEALVATVRENGAGAILILRLKVEDELVTQIETFVIRAPDSTERYEQLGTLDPMWFTAAAPSERASREELVSLANRYFDGLQRNDGRIIPPFVDGCERIEGGALVTNRPSRQRTGHWAIDDFFTRDLRSQFELGFFEFVTNIQHRRFPVVDDDRSVVFALALFDHDGTTESVRLTDGRVFETPPYTLTPRTLFAIEAFKIGNGLLRQVESNLTECPYGMPFGWIG